MKAKFTDFLGLQTGRLESDYCAVSVVNYKSAVSEEWHCHENFHLSAILKGGNLESRQKADIPVLPGNLLAYHPGEIHRNRFTKFPSRNLNLEIRDSFFKEHGLSPVDLNFTGLYTTDNYFNLLKIYHELKIQDSCTPDSIRISLVSMFAKDENFDAKAPWLRKLKEIIDDRWNEFVSLEYLSAELQVHPVTISKYFRRYYQCTLADYMRKAKVEKALYMLLNTKKSATEIAFHCGFSDQSHMTRLFKFYVGFKPKEISGI